MLLAKDEDFGQAPYTYTDKFLMLKVMICSLACAAGLFFVLAGQECIIGLVILVLGAVWNLMVPLNNTYSFTLSIMVAIVYGLICYNVGLVANAFIYVLYYVPLQFVACRRLEQTSIIKYKVLNSRQSVFFLVFFILFFVGLYLFSSSMAATSLYLLDALSAAMLAFSAMLRTLRTSEYILVRLLALGISIIMWALVVSSTAFYCGSVCVLIMYVMYFIYDLAEHIYSTRNHKFIIKEQLFNLLQDTRRKLLQLKKDEYNRVNNK